MGEEPNYTTARKPGPLCIIILSDVLYELSAAFASFAIFVSLGGGPPEST